MRHLADKEFIMGKEKVLDLYLETYHTEDLMGEERTHIKNAK